MTRSEHLLTILAEECCEVAQRVTKALRFGPNEIQPNQPLTNAERVVEELNDLLAVCGLLEDAGVLPLGWQAGGIEARLQKRAKVEKFLRYSEECGTLSAEQK